MRHQFFNCSDVMSDEQHCKALTDQLLKWLPEEAQVRCLPASIHHQIPETEKALVVRAVPSRQAEFIAARWGAHQALAALGYTETSLLAGPLGGPVWPSGSTGSITHESGICLVAVCHDRTIEAFGLDLFDTRRKTNMDELASIFMTGPELEDCPSERSLFFQRVFSAKEAVVKAVSAHVGDHMELRNIQLHFESSTFRANVQGLEEEVSGHWAQLGPFILTLALRGIRLQKN